MRDDRDDIVTLITEAKKAGARQFEACKIIGISTKTLQRWYQPDNHQDGHLDAVHEPSNKLTELERQRMISVANEPEYVDLPPSKIVPALADIRHLHCIGSKFLSCSKG